MTLSSNVGAVKVVPLLQALSRVEELSGALAMRIDPIVNHAPTPETPQDQSRTVTQRLQSLGDSLQYLLDNIEL